MVEMGLVNCDSFFAPVLVGGFAPGVGVGCVLGIGAESALEIGGA